jgi:hypothetical protein
LAKGRKEGRMKERKKNKQTNGKKPENLYSSVTVCYTYVA